MKKNRLSSKKFIWELLRLLNDKVLRSTALGETDLLSAVAKFSASAEFRLPAFEESQTLFDVLLAKELDVINFFAWVKLLVDFVKESPSKEFFRNHLSCFANDN